MEILIVVSLVLFLIGAIGLFIVTVLNPFGEFDVIHPRSHVDLRPTDARPYDWASE